MLAKILIFAAGLLIGLLIPSPIQQKVKDRANEIKDKVKGK